MLNVDGLHEDFSAFTKPRTCCHNGHEVIKVTEQDENWVVTLKEGGKRPRDDAIEAEHAVILVVGGGLRSVQAAGGTIGHGEGDDGGHGEGDGGGGGGAVSYTHLTLPTILLV